MNTDKKLERNESTETAREMWKAVDSAAEKAPEWIKERMMGTDEMLNKLLDAPGVEPSLTDIDRSARWASFAAQKAIEARDALRRIREATEMGQTFASAVSRPVLKAMVALIDGVLRD